MARSDDFMLTAEELRLRGLKRRRILLLLALALGLVLAGTFAGRPTLNAIKAFQARRHAARAFAFIDQEKWNEARSEAVAAYQLRATEPQALRAIARFLSRTRQQQALDFWTNLRSVASLTRDDLRDETTIALISGDPDRAAASLKILLADDGKNATTRDWLLAAQLAMQKANAEEVQRHLQKIFESKVATEREQLQAALLELQAAPAGESDLDKSARADAWSRITRLATGKTDTALDALLLLARRALSTKAELRNQMSDVSTDFSSKSDLRPQTSEFSKDEIIRRLESHPLAKAPQKLVAIDLQIHDNLAEKDAGIARAITEWKDADPTALVALGTWLNGKGEYERELETIPLEKALQTRELFLQHVDALGALGRWAEIKQLLNAERFPLDAVIQQMYLARCSAQLGEKAAGENNWRRALEAAGNDIQKLMTLAEYAEKNGALEIAEAAYNSAATEGPKLRAAQQGRLRLAQAQRDTKKIHGALVEMLASWPNDTAIQNDEAYTRLLLLGNPVEAAVSAAESQAIAGDTPATTTKSEISGQKSEASERMSNTNNQEPITENRVSSNEELITIEHLAEGLVRREPSSLPHRTLLALARLKQQRPIAALEVYSGIQVAPNALSPSALAIHAAVLAANSHPEEARAEKAKVPLEALLPEEQSLIANLRE